MKIYLGRNVFYFFFSDNKTVFSKMFIHTPDLLKYNLKFSAFQKMLNIPVLQSLSYKLTKKFGLHVMNFGTSQVFLNKSQKSHFQGRIQNPIKHLRSSLL